MAGVAGFEPAVHDTKNRCLTTWLHPNNYGFIDIFIFFQEKNIFYVSTIVNYYSL